MHTVIIGSGLTNSSLSAQHRYLTSEATVGQHEIDRLMGKGKAYGAGPLPTFLAAVASAAASDASTHLILIRPNGDDEANEPVDGLASSLDRATALPTEDGVLPWQPLLGSLRELTGMDPTSDDARRSGIRFLVVGTHTEREVASVATLLRNALGFSEVAVSPHLAGSSTREAHFAVLQHNLRQTGVRVLLDLDEVAAYSGTAPEEFAGLDCQRCAIEPADARDSMGQAQRHIIELLCMHWSRVHLRPLAGGFSGSLLFLADGWKGDARTEPMVLKIDNYPQMQREIGGYHRVKDFLGKHVPTFGYPVSLGGFLGVAMELAAMEGRPNTLQDDFEAAESEQAVEHFMQQIDKTLALLSDKLYRNTATRAALAPYRAFGLHVSRQLDWLQGNAEVIAGYLDEAGRSELGVDANALRRIVGVVATNPDSVQSESCLSHGDLNLANVIRDAGDNIWLIDWTHCDIHPLELDFAKLENDVKFVMSKAFQLDDLPRLRLFEEFLLASRIPAAHDELPEHVGFLKWDLRYRKILAAVRAIRKACFALKKSDDWLAYRVALLRYAMHTLSFDQRRGRGECGLPQLAHALYSVDALAMDLVTDDFHLTIRSERPARYPARQRISIDESPWLLDCESYDPPYYVDPAVLESDRTKAVGGWADPEDFELVPAEEGRPEPKYRDERGRARNPHGRTGVAGRGSLGRWGRNLAVAGVVVRPEVDTGGCEILVGRRPETTGLELPEGFVLPGENPQNALVRVVEKDTGWEPASAGSEVVFEGYTYDPRQTDHAWVESRAYLILAQESDVPDTFAAPGNYEEVRWSPVDSDVVNRLPARQARFVREAVPRMVAAGVLAKDRAEALLVKTG
ncbi:MAG: phosphotransferase [Planctomycetota bacterium]|jgi:ADP-ribose pyrophosphatase